MSGPRLQGLLADCDAEAVLRNAWCEFGGSNMDAEFWQVFSEAVNFTLKMAAACIGEAPAQTILRLTRERDEAREALREIAKLRGYGPESGVRLAREIAHTLLSQSSKGE